ncbi:MAG: magnesium transporter [Clostridia bacterium]
MANEQILDLINQKKFSDLRTYLNGLKEADIADEIEKIEEPDVLLKVFRLLKKDIAADVFTYLDFDIQKHLIETISEQELNLIMNDLYLDDTIDLIENLPANVVNRILRVTKAEKRQEINRFLGYEEKTAGSLMTSEYLDLKGDMKVSDCFKRIRKLAQDKETINTCYIVDDTKMLIGEISIRDLILASPTKLIKDVMSSNIIPVNTSETQEEVSSLFKKYNVNELPVQDMDNRMVGIITIDDVIDVIEEDTTEDFHKMAAIMPNDESYLKTSAFTHSKKRILWLTLLMISAIFTGILLTSYEQILSDQIILVSFLPLLMGLAGNCGSQASTLMIRGMVLEEISMKDYFKIFFKEFYVSLFMGSFLAIFNFFRIFIQYKDFLIATIIALTVILIVLIANLIGFTMPLLAKKLKLDPAVMAAPIITTILDCLVILTYFNIAQMLLY